jgi:hypothetical protein
LNLETYEGTPISDAIWHRISSESSSTTHNWLGRLVVRNNHAGSFLVGLPLVDLVAIMVSSVSLWVGICIKTLF